MYPLPQEVVTYLLPWGEIELPREVLAFVILALVKITPVDAYMHIYCYCMNLKE